MVPAAENSGEEPRTPAVRAKSVLVAFVAFFLSERNAEIWDKQMIRGQDNVIFPPGRTFDPRVPELTAEGSSSHKPLRGGRMCQLVSKETVLNKNYYETRSLSEDRMPPGPAPSERCLRPDR